MGMPVQSARTDRGRSFLFVSITGVLGGPMLDRIEAEKESPRCGLYPVLRFGSRLPDAGWEIGGDQHKQFSLLGVPFGELGVYFAR